LPRIKPPYDIELVDDIDDDCSDKKFADISPALSNELAPVALASGEEVPAVCVAALLSISQSPTNSEKGSHERLKDQPEVKGTFYAVDEVLPVLRN
jgi:hypothetical protein